MHFVCYIIDSTIIAGGEYESKTAVFHRSSVRAAPKMGRLKVICGAPFRVFVCAVGCRGHGVSVRSQRLYRPRLFRSSPRAGLCCFCGERELRARQYDGRKRACRFSRDGDSARFRGGCGRIGLDAFCRRRSSRFLAAIGRDGRLPRACGRGGGLRRHRLFLDRGQISFRRR